MAVRRVASFEPAGSWALTVIVAASRMVLVAVQPGQTPLAVISPSIVMSTGGSVEPH
jgi:hypothetical protein